jgi:RHS repeat-associated protein
VHTISGTTTQKDYCANVVYENGVQKLLLTEEGYVNLSDGKYYYYLKDHQGNNRVVINSSGTVQETNHYYPFGGVFASTGNVQPYKYNGKELDTQKGLNWYDYGARHYDATLGRWFVVDPLAEDYYSTSAYGYCLNNPVNIIDPLGTDTISVNNVNGKWDIIGVNVQSGDDVFRITIDGKTSVYTFGDGNYSNRMNILVLEGNENESLGIYHLSGTETAGYALQRGNPETAASGQKKRIPADVYNTYEGEGKLWPSYVGLKSDKVSPGRGIRVHYGENREWSEGCILLSSNYKKVNRRTIFNLTESRNAVWNYAQYLGATNRQLNVLTPSGDNPNRRRDRYIWKDKSRINRSNIIIKNK